MSANWPDEWQWEWRDNAGNAIFLGETPGRGGRDDSGEARDGGEFVLMVNSRQTILRLAAECLLFDGDAGESPPETSGDRRTADHAAGRGSGGAGC